MQNYHEAIKNARTNPKDTWQPGTNYKPTSSWKIEAKQMQFPEHRAIGARTFNNFFATAGEKAYNDVKQRNQTNGLDVQARHERTYPRITRKSSSWSPQPVQAADVILVISKLKNIKSTGHDQINLQHIKESLMVTIPYITLIINTSINT